MAKYLDPKADLTFKKIFGEHPDLVMSLLNALLPLENGNKITDTRYLPPERVPRTEEGKDSIVVYIARPTTNGSSSSKCRCTGQPTSCSACFSTRRKFMWGS